MTDPKPTSCPVCGDEMKREFHHEESRVALECPTCGLQSEMGLSAFRKRLEEMREGEDDGRLMV